LKFYFGFLLSIIVNSLLANEVKKLSSIVILETEKNLNQ